MGFRATLTFRKFKVALNPMYRIFLNLAKGCLLSCLSKFRDTKIFHRAVFDYKRFKLKLRVFLADHSVTMVTYCVTKIMPTCSPTIGQFFDNMIVVQKCDDVSTSLNVIMKSIMNEMRTNINVKEFLGDTDNYVKICKQQSIRTQSHVN